MRKLIVDDFTFSPQTGKFDLNVTWLKPSFNYSQISKYDISYQVNEGSKVKTDTVSMIVSLFQIIIVVM